MPTYRSITTSLVSQYDIMTIPEFRPPMTPIDPFSNAPILINPDSSLVSVYIPTYPSSQFWLSYSIAPPYPPKLFYYFKLSINGSPVVSWGCGEEDGYKGKTMFGLFGCGKQDVKQPLIEQRVLCFGPDTEDSDRHTPNNLSDVMEIKVFRSKGRQRIQPEAQDFEQIPDNLKTDKKDSRKKLGGGVNLVNAGILPDRHPRRFYKYALLDPLDQPFATFHYYYRSWDQLEAVGIIPPSTSIESSSIRTVQQPLSPRSSSNTINSYVSVSTSLGNSAANVSAGHGNHSSTRNSERHILDEDSTITSRSTTRTASSTATHDQDISSPLRIKITPPHPLPQPSTPPAVAKPTKLTQLPPQIPQTDTSLNTLASKESFTSLVRSHLPIPDTSAFQLHDPAEDAPRPPSPLRTRSSNLGALLGVVSSARSRRKSASNESEGYAPPGSAETGWSKANVESQIGSGVGQENADQMSEGEGEKKWKKEEKNDERRGRRKNFLGRTIS